MEMIWIAMLALAVLVIEAFRFSRIEKYQLQCEQSLHELRAHHDVLMRQTGKRLEGEYSKRIDGLMAQVANRDGVVEGLEEKLKVLADVRFLWISHLKEINYKFKTVQDAVS